MSLDGQRRPEYDLTTGFVFSPYGKRIAYTAMTGNRHFIVLDNAPRRPHTGIGAAVFSPDSKRLAYVAIDRDRQRMILDDEVGPEFNGVGRPVFSPDSNHLAYGAVKDGKRFAYAATTQNKLLRCIQK